MPSGASTTSAWSLQAGKRLRLEVLQPAIVHWSSDGWRTGDGHADAGHGAWPPCGRSSHGGRSRSAPGWISLSSGLAARPLGGQRFRHHRWSRPRHSEGGIADDEPGTLRCLRLFRGHRDLAYKKIFPALQAMIRRGHLDVPIIGVARAGWNLDRSRNGPAPASKRTAAASTRPPSPEARRAPALRRRRLPRPRRPSTSSGGSSTAAAHPIHYLAIPPSMFPVVIEHLGSSGCARRTPGSSSRSRSAGIWRRRRRSTQTLHTVFDESSGLPHRPLPRQGGGAEPPRLPLRQHLPGADLEPELRRERADHHGGGLRRAGPRHLLRGSRRHPRRRAKPPDAGGGLSRHGAARDHLPRIHPGRAGEGVPPDPAARSGRPRPRAVPGLPRRSRASRRIRRSRPSRRCGWKSTPGAGMASRSSSGPASACP